MRVGQRFGRLKLLEYLGRVNNRNRWLALCDCSNLKEFEQSVLPKVYSCGCWRAEVNAKLASQKAAVRVGWRLRPGQRFGRLRLLDRLGKVNNRHHWLVLCDCGNVKELEQSQLFKVFSCGCRRSEVTKTLAERRNAPPEPVLTKEERKRQAQQRWAHSPQGQATRRRLARANYLKRHGKTEVTRHQKVRKDSGSYRKVTDVHTLSSVWFKR